MLVDMLRTHAPNDRATSPSACRKMSYENGDHDNACSERQGSDPILQSGRYPRLCGLLREARVRENERVAARWATEMVLAEVGLRFTHASGVLVRRPEQERHYRETGRRRFDLLHVRGCAGRISRGESERPGAAPAVRGEWALGCRFLRSGRLRLGV